MAIKNYFPIVFILISVAGCTSASVAPLPQKDIVFQPPFNGNEEVGFIDSESGSIEISSIDDYIIRPVWSNSGEILFGLARDNQSVLSGTPSYWDKNGDQKKCDNLYFNSTQVEPFEELIETMVIVTNTKSIQVVDLGNCEIQNTLVDLSDVGGGEMAGVSYSSNRDLLLYGLQFKDEKKSLYQASIMQLELISGEEKMIAEGLNPGWSPDGSQFVFVRVDGIYIMDIDNMTETKVLAADFGSRGSDVFIDPYSAPSPHWSPDGMKLILHSCEKDVCNGTMEYSIVTLDLSTGEKEIYPQYGLYPDWKGLLP